MCVCVCVCDFNIKAIASYNFTFLSVEKGWIIKRRTTGWPVGGRNNKSPIS